MNLLAVMLLLFNQTVDCSSFTLSILSDVEYRREHGKCPNKLCYTLIDDKPELPYLTKFVHNDYAIYVNRICYVHNSIVKQSN